MLSIVRIVFGAAFALAWAYALGLIMLRRLAAPRVAALAVGSALASLLVFLLLVAGLAQPAVLAAIGAVSIALAWRFHGPVLKDPATAPAGRPTRVLVSVILGAYGVLYLVHALAPEIQSDAITYHLGLVAEYLRLGRFPDRVGFFEMVPQGMEMLFLPAFGFGQHSAAKLVHFGFLIATVPLMVRIGRRLGLGDAASYAAAVFYFCAPVVGTDGTCAYNDAALVFFVLTTFYLLLVWRDTGDDRYLVPAGLAAGFCYAIKFTGIVVLPLAVLAVLAMARKMRPALLLAGGLVMIAPWMIRNAVMCGNPVAPLFNRWFPNPYFHATMEQALLQNLYGGFRWTNALVELAVRGHAQGVYGPLFLALPVGLLALRSRAGRWCWLAAALLAAPWFFNVGARFLMPSFAFLALALALAVPKKVLAGALAFQAITCWPAAVDRYTENWRLPAFPWRAALRIQPEAQYLAEISDQYEEARMIQAHTRPGEKVFALWSVARAYTDREVLEYWHSATADRLMDALNVAGRYTQDPFYEVRAAWPARLLSALRFRLERAHPGEWCIHEAWLDAGGDRVAPGPGWDLSGWPGPWEMPLAFDGNLATRFRTWGPMRAGMYVQVELDRPRVLTGAGFSSHTPVYGVPVEFYGQGADGKWRLLSGAPEIERTPWPESRISATRAIRRAGFRYILAPAGREGTGLLGRLFLDHEVEWGLERVAGRENVWLFRIR